MVRIAAISLALLMSTTALAAAQSGDGRRGDGQRPNGGGWQQGDGGGRDSGQRPNGWGQRQQGGGADGQQNGNRDWSPRGGDGQRGDGLRGDGQRRVDDGQRPNGWGQRNPDFRQAPAPQSPTPPPTGQGFARRDGGNDYGLRGGDNDRRWSDRDGRRDEAGRGDGRWRDDGRRDDGRRDDGRHRDNGGRDWGRDDRGRQDWGANNRQDWGRHQDWGRNDWGRNDFNERRYAHGGDRYRDRDRGRSWYEPRHFHPHYRATYRYRAPVYVYPSGYFARRWTYGEYLPRGWYGPAYYLDWRAYGLPFPPIGCEWIRVGDSALLVDVWSGQILSIYYDLFW